ncbi:hypothetical protein JCM33374_g184 [Metschnikowia sp. JCM 33374]|nr:hypothetical protein JCM33374_g184 [Metschnikowia sp. JCM 33374]
MIENPQCITSLGYSIQESCGGSFGATVSRIPKGHYEIKDHSTEESLESNLTNDSESTSSATEFSNTVFTSFTSLEDSPISTGSEWHNTESGFQKARKLDILSQNDYLSFIYPDPVPPPSYDELPPGGCPKYPIIDGLYGNERLPGYAPAAFKFGICQKKQEWLSPYDISSNRSWKTVMMELNSTQLNFYVVSTQLEKILWNRSTHSKHESCTEFNDLGRRGFFSSLVTTNKDVDLFKICEKNGLLFEPEASGRQRYYRKDSRTGYQSSSQKSEFKPENFRNPHLIRSYSLQHAKFGLANDYPKKPNVLRLRLENEQFLIHFSSTQELIDWHLAISMGKDVSLDLSEREAPKYRTVPRRRRNTIGSRMFIPNESATRRSRAHSDPCPISTKSRFRLSFSGFLTKWSSQMSQATKEHSFDTNHSYLPSPTSNKKSNSRRNINTLSSVDMIDSSAIIMNATSQNIDAENECTISDDASDFQARNFSSNAEFPVDDSGDCYRIANDPHNSEEEYEDDLEEESDIEEVETESNQNPASTDSSRSLEKKINDAKWEPAHKAESRRRFIRNCLKCIRPFAFDEKWLNKSMVKPIKITPLISHYNDYNIAQVGYMSSSYSLKSIPPDSTGSKIFSNSKKIHASRLNGLAKSEISLNRVPYHNLQEYTVGSHCLIPRTL